MFLRFDVTFVSRGRIYGLFFIDLQSGFLEVGGLVNTDDYPPNNQTTKQPNNQITKQP